MATGAQQHAKKVRAENVHRVFNYFGDSSSNGLDSVFFLTQFPAFSTRPVKLCRVECRLKPFDTSLFTLELALLQVVEGDSQLRTFPITNAHAIWEKSLTVDLSPAGWVVQPDTFFLGYHFVTKNHRQRFSYRLYCTTRGLGATLELRKGVKYMYTSPHSPNVFPFRITYLEN